jgi:Kdo2-lipid IVA lauroyltransferase/acyltransferase
MAVIRKWINYWISDPFWGGTDYLTHFFLRCLTLRHASACGALIGSIARYRFKSANQNVAANLEFLVPGITQAQIKKLSAIMWGNIGRTLSEMAVLDRFDLNKHVVIKNQTIMEQVARNKPVVFLYPHLGDWELLAIYIVSLGFKLNIVYERLPNRFQRRLVASARRRSGYDLIASDYSGTKRLFKVLAEGQAVGIAMDEFKDEEIISPRFDGRKIGKSNIHYAISLARRFNATIVSGYCVRTDALHFEIVCAGLIDLTSPLYRDMDGQVLAKHINDQCRDWIIKHPEQWYMLHRARLNHGHNAPSSGTNPGYE